MKKLSFITIFSIAIFAAACSSSSKVSKTVTGLSQNNWQLYSLGSSMVSPPKDGKIPSLSFDTEKMQVSGNSGCNNFTGSFTADKDKLSFGTLSSTKMMCPDMKMETDFLNAISKTATFSMYQEKLVLKDASGTQLMSFDPVKK